MGVDVGCTWYMEACCFAQLTSCRTSRRAYRADAPLCNPLRCSRRQKLGFLTRLT